MDVLLELLILFSFVFLLLEDNGVVAVNVFWDLEFGLYLEVVLTDLLLGFAVFFVLFEGLA